MTRDEFKRALTQFVDEVVSENRDLTEDDRDNLCNQVGDSDAIAELLDEDESEDNSDAANG